MAKAKDVSARVDTGPGNLLSSIDEDGILTMVVDTHKSFGRCKGTKPKDAPATDTGPWGKNIKVASTGAIQTIDQQTGLQIGVNVFRLPNDQERKDLY